ncbi:MAG: hypothetical protein M0R73_12470 [Dehalococcoidia bacterium]|nr:hypothetical protein [Dehalococcoidia bacterium]
MSRPEQLLVLGPSAWSALVFLHGSAEQAATVLLQFATERGRPVGVHLEDTTTFVGPEGWSEERLRGYVAGFRDEIESLFGEAEAK